MNNEPRPWSCSTEHHIFCTHHGNCTCPNAVNPPSKWLRAGVSLRCPLHGMGSTHPYAEPRMVRPS